MAYRSSRSFLYGNDDLGGVEPGFDETSTSAFADFLTVAGGDAFVAGKKEETTVAMRREAPLNPPAYTRDMSRTRIQARFAEDDDDRADDEYEDMLDVINNGSTTSPLMAPCFNQSPGSQKSLDLLDLEASNLDLGLFTPNKDSASDAQKPSSSHPETPQQLVGSSRKTKTTPGSSSSYDSSSSSSSGRPKMTMSGTPIMRSSKRHASPLAFTPSGALKKDSMDDLELVLDLNDSPLTSSSSLNENKVMNLSSPSSSSNERKTTTRKDDTDMSIHVETPLEGDDDVAGTSDENNRRDNDLSSSMSQNGVAEERSEKQAKPADVVVGENDSKTRSFASEVAVAEGSKPASHSPKAVSDEATVKEMVGDGPQLQGGAPRDIGTEVKVANIVGDETRSQEIVSEVVTVDEVKVPKMVGDATEPQEISLTVTGDEVENRAVSVSTDSVHVVTKVSGDLSIVGLQVKDENAETSKSPSAVTGDVTQAEMSKEDDRLSSPSLPMTTTIAEAERSDNGVKPSSSSIELQKEEIVHQAQSTSSKEVVQGSSKRETAIENVETVEPSLSAKEESSTSSSVMVPPLVPSSTLKDKSPSPTKTASLTKQKKKIASIPLKPNPAPKAEDVNLSDEDCHQLYNRVWGDLRKRGWTYRRGNGLVDWLFVSPDARYVLQSERELIDCLLFVDRGYIQPFIDELLNDDDSKLDEDEAKDVDEELKPKSKRTKFEADVAKEEAISDEDADDDDNDEGDEEVDDEEEEDGDEEVDDETLWNVCWPDLKKKRGWRYKAGTGLVDWVFVLPDGSKEFDSPMSAMEWVKLNEADTYESALETLRDRRLLHRPTTSKTASKTTATTTQQSKRVKVEEEDQAVVADDDDDDDDEEEEEEEMTTTVAPKVRLLEDAITFDVLWKHLKTKGWTYRNGRGLATWIFCLPGVQKPLRAGEDHLVDTDQVFSYCTRHPEHLRGLELEDGTDASTIQFELPGGGDDSSSLVEV